MGESGELARIGLARDQGFDHGATAQAGHVGDGRVELDVGILQRPLEPLDMAAPLPHQLLAGPQQAAQLLRLGIRHEAAPDKPVGKKVGQPGGVAHVALAARHVLHMRGVGQHQLEVAVAEDVPDRLPVHAGRLHGDIPASL
jgi:hypothetical protein